MSRSRRDGRHQGGHKRASYTEWSSRRGHRGFKSAGRFTKTQTHQLERREARVACDAHASESDQP